MRPLSILLLGTQMAIGGAQRGLLDQACWFKSRGCKVTVTFFYDKEGLYEKWSRAVDFPIHNLEAYEPGSGFLRQAGQLRRGLGRLWKLLLRERFDVVETFTHDSNLLGLPLAWLGGVPVRIATHRGRLERFSLGRQRLHSWLVNVGIASTLVVVSEQTRQQAMDEGVRSDRIVVIPNGVMPLDTASINGGDARKELGLAEDDLFLLSIGRLTSQKGHEHFIQAMPNVIRRFPTAKAWICGDGPLRAQLESQILELGLSGHVRLLGSRNDVTPLLATADIFVLPSRSEGLSRALMEAMAAGIPVVATNVGGIRDLITDGVHGLLVPSEDPERLAQSILQLLAAPRMRKRMGAVARAHVLEAHSTDIMCQRYYELILGFLENK